MQLSFIRRARLTSLLCLLVALSCTAAQAQKIKVEYDAINAEVQDQRDDRTRARNRCWLLSLLLSDDLTSAGWAC
jgi:hypothetical protein